MSLSRKVLHPDELPALVYADAGGNIMDFPGLRMAGTRGLHPVPPLMEELIPLPEGSELFLLPGRRPVGFDPEKHEFVTLREKHHREGQVHAVAAFVSPGHTQLLTAAYESGPDAPVLPLFAYTAVGWKDGTFWVAAKRVDPSARQEFHPGHEEEVAAGVRELTHSSPENRLLKHLMRCALSYGCPAAKNLFLGREEAPLPTAKECNARCVGCISEQPESSGFPATQPRITFTPEPGEIAEVALMHFARAPSPVASFGQGCEGEPLFASKAIARSLEIIRADTDLGTLNMNTNASLPEKIRELREAGLDSIRVTLLSFRPEDYNTYHRPRGYSFGDVMDSIRVFKAAGGFVSVNYLVMPGFTDTEEEAAAFFRALEELEIDFVQLRNLNIDPELFFSIMGEARPPRPLGVLGLTRTLGTDFPGVGIGYFNPHLEK